MKPAKKLVTFILPKTLLAEAKAAQKKHGIRTLSLLLRVAMEGTNSLNFKAREEENVQISFRVDAQSYTTLNRLAGQNGKSVAEIVRMLLKNINKIPAKKLTEISRSSKNTAPTKKPAPAKKSTISKKGSAGTAKKKSAGTKNKHDRATKKNLAVASKKKSPSKKNKKR